MFLAPTRNKAWRNQSQQGPASGRGLKWCRHARRVRHDWCRGLVVANRAGPACGRAWSSRLAARTSDCSCSNASTASTRSEASPCKSTTASLCEFYASDPNVRTSGSSAISASLHREPERDVVQPQRQGPLGSRSLRVARHGFGDPVGRALDRFRHGCGEGVLAATTMPAADLMETSKLGWSLEWVGAERGAPTRQNRRRRRWPT